MAIIAIIDELVRRAIIILYLVDEIIAAFDFEIIHT